MATVDLERLRALEFSRLDRSDEVYLDYTGAALYPASLVRRHARLLTSTVLGNPHSESRPSRLSTDAVERARADTLHLLDADPAVYDVVFTANASGAIRILAEAFPFRRGSRLVLTADNHNSVNGLRLAARRRRATVASVPLDAELRAEHPGPQLTAVASPSLFAFPAQSNFSGVRHPLAWVGEAQRAGYRVLLDAASYAATSVLSLRRVPADYVALSFYKLFGYPTGVGALVARREALALLRRRYFAGGTVQFVSVQNDLMRLKAGAEAFEDGTPSFLAMHAVCDGLAWLDDLRMPEIERRVGCLTSALLDRLEALGDRVTIYGPRGRAGRGGTIAFNLRGADGGFLPCEAVEAAAREHRIAIRGGCFCNPGAAERAFAYPRAAARRCLQDTFSMAGFRGCLGPGPVGAVRASVGVPTSTADLDRLTSFLTDLAARA